MSVGSLALGNSLVIKHFFVAPARCGCEFYKTSEPATSTLSRFCNIRGLRHLNVRQAYISYVNSSVISNRLVRHQKTKTSLVFDEKIKNERKREACKQTLFKVCKCFQCAQSIITKQHFIKKINRIVLSSICANKQKYLPLQVYNESETQPRLAASFSKSKYAL